MLNKEESFFYLFLKCFVIILVIGYLFPKSIQLILNYYIRIHFISGNSVFVLNGNKNSFLDNYISIFNSYFLLRL